MMQVRKYKVVLWELHVQDTVRARYLEPHLGVRRK
jgi:hypothetical protein